MAALASGATAAPLEFIVTPYVLLPSTNGKFGVGPYETNVDSSPADLFRKLNWAVLGSAEINNGVWGVNLDANYINLDVSNDDVRKLSINGHQAAYTAILLRRIDEAAWVYAGVRVNDFGLRLDCNRSCPGLLPPGTLPTDVSRNKSWVDPIIGFRATLPFNARLSFLFNGDIGGFGAGSKISASVWPQLGWKIGPGTALAGYKIMYVDYDRGSGRNRFLYDAATFGPTLGYAFRF